MDAVMQDAPVEAPEAPEVPKAAQTTTSSPEFLPPSIDETALFAGDTYSYFSPVPPLLHADDPSAAVPCFLGVDEAGRGPVLGPMVYGVFYAPAADADALLRGTAEDDDEHHRFDDSKVLSPAVRATLMAALCRPGSALHRACGWATAALSARDISADMLAPVGAAAGNLNAQAADATVSLIRGVLARGVRVTDVFVDTVGPPASYQKKLERFFPGLRITVAKKADSLYPCVSAASVCAKVTRDVALEVLYRRYQDAAGTSPDWGSGYPSDGRCTTWLRHNMHPLFGWGPECRFSWGTAKDMLEDDAAARKNGCVRVEWPLPDDADAPGASRLTDFFVTAPPARSRDGDADEEPEPLASWFGRPAGLEAF